MSGQWAALPTGHAEDSSSSKKGKGEKDIKLSIIVPVYNEVKTIREVIRRIQAVGEVEKEIIIVDDGSNDGTRQELETLGMERLENITILFHKRNLGKGTAIRTGLEHAHGEIVIIQDADLEQDPADYPYLLEPFRNPEIQVVYGSRILGSNPRPSWSFYWGVRLLTWITNLLYGANITDEATGYKVFRTALLRELDLESVGFEFCPEVTAKVLRQGMQIYEVPIFYQPRSKEEGKKIRWKDGAVAIWTLLKYRF